VTKNTLSLKYLPNYSKTTSPAQPNRGEGSFFQSTIADTDNPINDKSFNVCGFTSKTPVRFIAWASVSGTN